MVMEVFVVTGKPGENALRYVPLDRAVDKAATTIRLFIGEYEKQGATLSALGSKILARRVIQTALGENNTTEEEL
jgi:hypothetical protein